MVILLVLPGVTHLVESPSHLTRPEGFKMGHSPVWTLDTGCDLHSLSG